MKKQSNPYDSLLDSLVTFIDSEFEGSDITDEERELSKKRFIMALNYIIVMVMEKQKDLE